MSVDNKLCCSEHLPATDRQEKESLIVWTENISCVQTTEALDSVKKKRGGFARAFQAIGCILQKHRDALVRQPFKNMWNT